MYHYVRPEREDFPYFRYLHVDDFTRQLDWIVDNLGVVTREAFADTLETGIVAEGAVLTFDDGFVDHHEHVLPALVERGLWGVFYVPTGVHERSALLDVHKIHQLIGRRGGVAVRDALLDLVDDDMLVERDRNRFGATTYRSQENDEATTEAKRILNYVVSYDHRDALLDHLFAELIGDQREASAAWYMSTAQLRDLAEHGMVIGSHSVTHRVFSRLDEATQRDEIVNSFRFLEHVIGEPVETFCYPYGGFHNFNSITERLLVEHGCRYAFNVEPRDVEGSDVLDRPTALPRYDCNMFPHGQAAFGRSRPD